jgi:hypothetical protein
VVGEEMGIQYGRKWGPKFVRLSQRKLNTLGWQGYRVGSISEDRNPTNVGHICRKFKSTSLADAQPMSQGKVGLSMQREFDRYPRDPVSFMRLLHLRRGIEFLAYVLPAKFQLPFYHSSRVQWLLLQRLLECPVRPVRAWSYVHMHATLGQGSKLGKMLNSSYRLILLAGLLLLRGVIGVMDLKLEN